MSFLPVHMFPDSTFPDILMLVIIIDKLDAEASRKTLDHAPLIFSVADF